MKSYFICAILANAVLVGHTSAYTSANSSSGFASAQLSDSQSSSHYWDPSAGQYVAEQKDVKAETKFNFRGQRADANASSTALAKLKASALVASTNAPFDELRSNSSASFSDGLTFDVAGMTGQNILVFMRAEAKGIASSSGAANGSSYFSVSLGSGSTSSSGWSGSGWNSGFLNPNETQRPYRIAMVKVGQVQSLGMSLSSSCSLASFNQGGSCSIDATASFLGIEALATLSGDEITNFTIKSTSGINYLSPTAVVPEPTSYALMLLGLGLIGAYSRKKVS